MGYDFEALEDGIVTVEFRSYDSKTFCSKTSHDYYVKKGEKYYVEYTGVDILER